MVAKVVEPGNQPRPDLLLAKMCGDLEERKSPLKTDFNRRPEPLPKVTVPARQARGAFGWRCSVDYVGAIRIQADGLVCGRELDVELGPGNFLLALGARQRAVERDKDQRVWIIVSNPHACKSASPEA